MGRPQSGRQGFTLIEILVVVAIISVLASIVTAGAFMAQERARQGVARVFIAAVTAALEDYALDTGRYPGWDRPDDENAFPALYEALCGLRPPRGGGGPSAPYMEFKHDSLLVEDEDGAFHAATLAEIRDPKVPKFVQDPWGNPYVYRENRMHANRKFAMRPGKADVYSTGRDRVDQTASGDKGDDIGNW